MDNLAISYIKTDSESIIEVIIDGLEVKQFPLNTDIIDIFNSINKNHHNIIEIKHNETIEAVKYITYLVNANLTIKAITNREKMFDNSLEFNNPNIIEIKNDGILKANKHTIYSFNINLTTKAKTDCMSVRMFGEPLEFDSPTNMRKIIFKGDVILQCDFAQDVSFKNCEFYGNFSASNCKFQSNVYFNNAVFNNYADFHESTFKQTTCFYGVTFKEVPNFSACQFKEHKAVNLVNVDMASLDFKKVENFIENNFNDEQCKIEIKQDSTNKPIIEQKHRLKYAKNIKDSFRTIKDILITQNNTLDAQEWHKLELYAKEIEIINKQYGSERFKYFIDRIQLAFYRHISDHHTDLLRIMNNFVLLVALFVIFYNLNEYITKPYEQIMQVVKNINVKANAIALMVIMVVYYCIKKFIRRYEMLNEIIQSFRDLAIAILYIISYTIIFPVALIVIYGIMPIGEYLTVDSVVYLMYYYEFIVVYCVLVFVDVQRIRNILLVILYIFLCIYFANNPYIVIPTLEVFNKKATISQAGLSIVYSVLAFLLIFSLQKTARKNSIIPS